MSLRSSSSLGEVSTLGSGGISWSAIFLSSAEPTRVLELELLRVRARTLRMPLLLVEEEREGVGDVRGVRECSPEGVRERCGLGLRMLSSTGMLSHEMESLEKVSLSALEVRVDEEEWVLDLARDGRRDAFEPV